MIRLVLIFILFEIWAPSLLAISNKCRRSLQVYGQVKVSLEPFSGVQVVDLSEGYQARIVHGSEFSHSSEGSDLIKQYLFGVLPKLYQSELGAPPELLNTINDSSLVHMNKLTLVVLGRVNQRGEFEIVGGTGLYYSRGFTNLPLASELEALHAMVKLPRTLESASLVEIGRLAMVNADWMTPTVKRTLFVRMQGIVKAILLNEIDRHVDFQLLSFTTGVHERFYRSLGVRINHLAEVDLEIDRAKRYIGEVEILSLPE